MGKIEVEKIVPGLPERRSVFITHAQSEIKAMSDLHIILDKSAKIIPFQVGLGTTGSSLRFQRVTQQEIGQSRAGGSHRVERIGAAGKRSGVPKQPSGKIGGQEAVAKALEFATKTPVVTPP